MGMIGCVDASLTRWDPGTEPCPTPASARPWAVAAPAGEGMDAAALEALVTRAEQGELGNLHSILVVRNGRLVFERYFSGPDMTWGNPPSHVTFDAATLHDLRSVTKSVMGALVGIAHGDGLLPDLDARLLALVPAASVPALDRMEGITLRHALTMTARL